MPEVAFVFVGPEVTRQRPLHGVPNIHLLGERPYAELPAYFAGADACWIPFAPTDHTMGRDCVKLYEYLATGRPIVTTPLPRAEQFGDCVVVVEATADGLAQACRQALSGRSDDSRERRLGHARQHTWQRRAGIGRRYYTGPWAGPWDKKQMPDHLKC